MSIGCNCASGLSNTGRPNCVPLQSVTSKLIMVPLFGADGTANFIDLTSPLPTWADLINEVDATKRWFPLPNFENVEMPKADSQFEEANSGRMVFYVKVKEVLQVNFGLMIQRLHCWVNYKTIVVLISVFTSLILTVI